MENEKKTQVLRMNLLKTIGKLRCCVGTYENRKENTCVALESIENTMKTQVLRGNL